MFTRPDDLSDGEIVDALRVGWGVEAATVEYVAAGFGSYHWRVETEAARWFVNADRAAKREQLAAALGTARSLHDGGLEFVVGPEPAVTGELLVAIGANYVVARYPFVEGVTSDSGAYDDAAERLAVFDHLVRLHAAPPPAVARRDDFVIPRRRELEQACAHLHQTWNTGPYGEPARELLARHEHALTAAFARYDELVRAVRPDEFVVTHGEPHRGNTIMTPNGVLLIDWDTVLLAPRERDLWAIGDEDPSTLVAYEQRANVALRQEMSDLYRLRWDLVEIAAFIAQFRRPHTANQDTNIASLALERFLDPSRWQPRD